MLFNQNKFFVSIERADRFVGEVRQAKDWYLEELKKVEVYAQGDYVDLANSGIDIPEYDEPKFMIQEIELQTKSVLVEIIKRYFNKDVFEKNRSALYGQEVFKEESIETPNELWVSLNVHKDHIYSLLSILGHYQRNNKYFLSQLDFYKICCEYSNQVYYINRNLGMKYRFVNIFLSSQRIKSASKSSEVDESYQSDKFIDVDKLSLLALLQPYLKHNTHEINKIIEIMMKNLRGRHGGIAWDSTLKEVNQFIAECEAKGIMKRLE